MYHAELPFGERMAKMERGGRSKTPVAAREEGAPRLTEPKTPKFSSFRRNMGAKVKSAAEREEVMQDRMGSCAEGIVSAWAPRGFARWR